MSNLTYEQKRNADPKRKAYKRAYQRKHVARRRAEWINENGPCQRCGSWNEPEIDHVDPALKEHSIATLWSRRKSARANELAKCQVLCAACHRAKSTAEARARKGHTKCRGISAETARKVRELAKAGHPYRDIAWQLGVKLHTVKDIGSGRKYQRI